MFFAADGFDGFLLKRRYNPKFARQSLRTPPIMPKQCGVNQGFADFINGAVPPTATTVAYVALRPFANSAWPL